MHVCCFSIHQNNAQAPAIELMPGWHPWRSTNSQELKAYPGSSEMAQMRFKNSYALIMHEPHLQDNTKVLETRYNI